MTVGVIASEFASVVLFVLGALACIACAYLALLAALARWPAVPLLPKPSTRFVIVVPAHNETSGIAVTLRSLLSVDYPAAMFRVLVVADNCTDDTADKAKRAGAHVLVRKDPNNRGKGFALAYAFEHLRREGFADAVMVVDADTIVSKNLLRACAARVAAGEDAVQVDYAVRNHDSSWRTRLMTLAFTLFHVVRSLGRERLGLSAGLRGNGMAFTLRVLSQVPHTASSVVEDLEYGIMLGLSGFRVCFAPEARVWGEMPDSGDVAKTQRQRWEDGRRLMRRHYALPLLRRAIRERSLLLLDLSADLIVPPLTELFAFTLFGLLATASAPWWMGRQSFALVLWMGASIGLSFYIMRGWAMSKIGPRGLLDLAYAPAYVMWKLALKFKPASRSTKDWVRTTRKGEAS